MNAEPGDLGGAAPIHGPDEVDPTGLEQIAGRIRRSLRPGPRTPALVIVVSSRVKFQLGGHDFGVTTLDIADSRDDYYLTRVIALRRGLRAFIEANDFRTVCCIGGSKGAYGALMISRLLAQDMLDRTFSAFACSPQIRLWPPNDLLPYPRYQRFLSNLGELDQVERRRVKRFADITQRVDLPNLRWLVSYGARHEVDRAEATSLSGASVVLDPLPISFHTSMLFYLAQGLDRDAVGDVLRRFEIGAGIDEDVAFVSLRDDADDVIDEIEAAPPRPHFTQMIRWLVDKGLVDADRLKHGGGAN